MKMNDISTIYSVSKKDMRFLWTRKLLKKPGHFLYIVEAVFGLDFLETSNKIHERNLLDWSFLKQNTFKLLKFIPSEAEAPREVYKFVARWSHKFL